MSDGAFRGRGRGGGGDYVGGQAASGGNSPTLGNRRI